MNYKSNINKNCTQELRGKRAQGMIWNNKYILPTLKEAGSFEWTAPSSNVKSFARKAKSASPKPYAKFHLSHMAWNTALLCLNQWTISLSTGVLFITESNIGLPKNFGEVLNDHILSLGQGLCGCFSWIDKHPSKNQNHEIISIQ